MPFSFGSPDSIRVMSRSAGAASPTDSRAAGERLEEIYAYCKDEVLGWSFVCTERESTRLAA